MNYILSIGSRIPREQLVMILPRNIKAMRWEEEGCGTTHNQQHFAGGDGGQSEALGFCQPMVST